MQNTSRRDILAIMGFGGAAAALNTEAIARVGNPDTGPTLVYGSPAIQARMADALTALASSIRSGEVIVARMTAETDMNPVDEHWLKHELRLVLEVVGEPPSV